MENTTCTYDEECTLRSNAFTKTGHTFAGWKHGDNNYTNGQKVTNLATSGTVTLDAKWTKNTYTISFNNNDGEGSMADLPMTYSEAQHLTKNTFTRTGYTFAGWNTQANGEGTNYDDEQEVNNLTAENNATITLYAKWTKNEGTLVCKAAETLHTQTCETGGSCSGLTNANVSGGTIVDGTITYGYYPNSNPLKAGDAFTCDINNNGIFDEEEERFYYLADDGENARLIYYTGYDNGPDTIYNGVYDDALAKLPTNAQWTNPNLVNFDDGSLTSFPFVDDVTAACGNNTITGSVKPCIYLIENTTFSRKRPTNGNSPRSGIWLHTYNDGYYRINTNSSTLGVTDVTNATTPSKNTARPVIQVPLSLMEIPEVVDMAALVNGQYKDTLQEAINAASDNVKTTVKVLKNLTETVTVSADKNIDLDLNGFTVANTGKNTIVNYGTLEIRNGTLTDSSDSATIDTHSGSILNISDNTAVRATGKKQALYNNGGTVTISGENIVLSSTVGNRATIHTLVDSTTNVAGITYIKSGTIESTGAYAVYNDGGTTIIGEKDGEISLSAPIITGKTYGIIATVGSGYEIYDGVIKGKTHANGTTTNGGTTPTVSNDTNNERVNAIEDNSTIVKETINSYNTMYLEKSSDYHITFDGNGGEASEASRIVPSGSSLGTLPTAEYPRFNFLGWFTDKNNGEEVTAGTEPSGETTDITYFAHWEAIPQDEIVSFYTPSKAAKGYFNNINSWSENIVYTPYVSQGYTPTSSMITFWGNLKTNYERNDCNNSDALDISSDFSNYTYTSGTVKCDQPRTFDTGVNGKVNVYLSDESTKVKGALVSYTKSNNGKITNMIPGTTYYWESDADSSVYGYVKATGERRFLNIGTIRNARDLGGLTTSDNKKIKYGILIRGDKLRSNAANATELGDLGITKEYDLRGESAGDAKMSNYVDIRTRQYHFNYPYSDPTDTTELGYYNDTRTAFESLMRDVVAGEKIYFHCTYGADRTGTIAYLVETILGVDYDQRVKDYELTTLAGEADRTRIYNHKVGSSFFSENKFVYMVDFISTKKDAEDWFKAGLATETERDEADALIASFRAKMLE